MQSLLPMALRESPSWNGLAALGRCVSFRTTMWLDASLTKSNHSVGVFLAGDLCRNGSPLRRRRQRHGLGHVPCTPRHGLHWQGVYAARVRSRLNKRILGAALSACLIFQ